LTAFKIAAHAADIGLHRPGARDRDDAISDARAQFDWEKQFELALEPARPRLYRAQAVATSSQPDAHGSEFCTMCGENFCSVRLSKKLREKALE